MATEIWKFLLAIEKVGRVSGGVLESFGLRLEYFTVSTVSVQPQAVNEAKGKKTQKSLQRIRLQNKTKIDGVSGSGQVKIAVYSSAIGPGRLKTSWTSQRYTTSVLVQFDVVH